MLNFIVSCLSALIGTVCCFLFLPKLSRQDLGLEDAVHVGRALGVEPRAQVQHLGVGLRVIDRVQRLLHGEGVDYRLWQTRLPDLYIGLRE